MSTEEKSGVTYSNVTSLRKLVVETDTTAFFDKDDANE